MSSKRSCWDIYNKQMSLLNHGDALWEPAPLPYFGRIQPGDVGYIRRGCFHLLFSAGCPLGERQLGIDVPLAFKPLAVGPIFNTQPRLPGSLSTSTVRETQVRLTPPTSPVPMLEPGSSIAFQLTEDQGAALVTKYQTYREDAQRERTFEEYTKVHYNSWVAFAREAGHGNDIKPVLVTGVDMTRDFAMMAYSGDDVDMASEFTTSVPGVASAWGSWRTTGSVYTNCGPQLCRPPSPTQTTDLTPSGNSHTETVSDEYNQCVFVRYYTVRKRLGIPRVIRAAAGPHDLGPGGSDDEGPSLEAQYDSDSDSDSDIAPSLFDDDGEDDRSSVTSIDSEPEIVVHNTTLDERDDFDTIADYVFRNSDAESVLIHHRDIALLREPGGSPDLSTQLIEKRSRIAVDQNGVGTIGPETDPPANTWSNDPLGIGPPTPLSIPSEIQHEATNRMVLPEPKPRQQYGESEPYVLPCGSPEAWEGPSHFTITRQPRTLPLIRVPVASHTRHWDDPDTHNPLGGLLDPTQPCLDGQALLSPSKGNIPAPTEEIEDERVKHVREQAEADMASQMIDESLREAKKLVEKRKKATKVLLLGQAESGKSTILKNFQLSFCPSQSKNEGGAWRSVIQFNLISALRAVLQVAQDLETIRSLETTSPVPGFSRRNGSIIGSSSGPSTRWIGDTEDREPILTDAHQRLRMRLSPHVSMEENLNKIFSPHPPDPREVSARGGTNRKPYLTRLAKEKEQNHSRPTSSRDSIPQEDRALLVTFKEDIIALLSDPVVYRVLKRQGCGTRNMPGFFLDDVRRIAVRNREPSNRYLDIVKVGLKMFGVEEYHPAMEDGLFSASEDNGDWYLCGVGGGQSLRSQWVPFFDDVQAIIFSAPLTFDLGPEEDLIVNQPQDSLTATFESGLRVTSYHGQRNGLTSVLKYFRQHFKAYHVLVSIPGRDFSHSIVVDTNSTSTVLFDVRKSIIFSQLSGSDVI